MDNDGCTNLEDAMTLSLPVDAGANELLTRSPLALLIALVLDQQVPLEKAFGSPQVLVQRLGHEPTAEELADYDPEALAAVFSERPALHRFPRGGGAPGRAGSRPPRNWPITIPRHSPRSSASGRPCTGSRGRWPPASRNSARSLPIATTATRPGSGGRRRPARSWRRGSRNCPGSARTRPRS